MLRRRGAKSERGRSQETGADIAGPRHALDDDADFASAIDDAAESGDRGAQTEGSSAQSRASGPWDVSELDDADSGDRLDLGALRIPPAPNMELRMEVAEETREVVALACIVGESALQLQAVAAPRSGGLWREVRRDLAEDIRAQGGQVHEQQGVFGEELAAEMSVPGPDGRQLIQPARFLGVEGPRWMLQGIITGPAATDAYSAAPLEDLLRNTVVVRGDGPMARGEGLALRLPPDAEQEPGHDHSGHDHSGHDHGVGPDRSRLPDPFTRGPEITEVH